MRLPAKLIMLICVLPSTQAEEIYREVDDDGIPSFSDHAMPGAEPIEVREPVVFTDPTYKRNQTNRRDGDRKDPVVDIDYLLAITDPANGAAIRSNPGNLSITVAIAPSLHSDHRAELLMDGTKIQTLKGSGPVELTNLDRGTHAFSIRVVDRQGKIIKTGPTTSVTVLRYHKRPG